MGSSRGVLVTVLATFVLPASPGAAGGRGKIVVVEHQRSEMVLVPGGTFVMGATASERANVLKACVAQLGRAQKHCNSQQFMRLLHGSLVGTTLRRRRSGLVNRPLRAIPARKVYVSPFQIDRHEVTVSEYRACVAVGRCSLTPLVTGDPFHLASNKPIVNVTWQDAVDYCTWRNKRLPTEAEWEKAARSTRGWRWPWGNHDRIKGANHGRIQAESVLLARRASVGAFVPEFRPDPSDGARYAVRPGFMRWSESRYGAYDMAGNVSEWVDDWFSEEGYTGLSSFNPHRARPELGQNERVVRGGSWNEPKYMARTYVRGHDKPGIRRVDRGFRCARDAQR